MRILFVIIFVIYTQSAISLIDLEVDNNIIIETKKINITEFPYAFNPSIVRWQGEIWMSFRFFPDKTNTWDSRFGLIKLTEDFEIVGKPFILDCLDCDFNQDYHSLEDGRLITNKDKLYIIYNDHVEPMDSLQRRVFMAEIYLEGDKFLIKNKNYFLEFEGENPKRMEKNWIPFVNDERLYLSYAINPHRILVPKDGFNSCDTLTSTEKKISWKWGELRGGTPAFPVGNEYLALFHSSKDMSSVQSKGKRMPHYFMGAYTFSAEYPFHITKISREPLIKNDFYKEPISPYWSPKLVVFPCGYIIDDEYIWVSYGRADLECYIAKINRKKLLESLVPIEGN